MGLEIVELKSLEECEAAAWDDLVARSPGATIFQSHGWMRAWWRSQSTDAWSMHLVAAYRDRALVGLGPFFSEGDASRATVRLIGEGHADYQGLIVENNEPETVAAILERLLAVTRRSANIHFDELPVDSPLESWLGKSSANRPLTFAKTGLTPCPRLRLRGRTQEVQQLLSKKSLRRHRSALERTGRVEIRHETQAEAIRPYLPLFFEQHVRRWSPTAFPSLFRKPQNRDFYCGLLDELCPRGRIVFSVLRVDDRPIACHFGLVSNSSLLWYKPAFDVDWARCSPGEVLLGFLIEYAVANDYEMLDFTRGDEKFKSRFGSEIASNHSYVRYGSRLAALEHHARGAVRKLIRGA